MCLPRLGWCFHVSKLLSIHNKTQDAVLFSGTVRENLFLGFADLDAVDNDEQLGLVREYVDVGGEDGCARW